MATITLGGNAINTSGRLPLKGEQLKNFKLVNPRLETKSLEDYKGKKIVMNIFPSVDTSVCATSVRKFNEKAASLENTVVLNISKDLPFAQKRFCAAEGIDHVEMLSEFRDDHFSRDYGVRIESSGMEGLMSRAIVTADENGNVLYSEQVPEIKQEPDYEAALDSIN